MERVVYKSIAQGLYKPQVFNENVKSIDPEMKYLQMESKKYNGNTLNLYFSHTYSLFLKLHHMEGDESNPSGTTILTISGYPKNIKRIEEKISDLEKELQAKSLKTH
ncbi:MAG: hypothetical protein Q7S27_06200 [Nanoarchaeota archaeon]|nr:hypothetical protein [Nanoarchaeota archaeon]